MDPNTLNFDLDPEFWSNWDLDHTVINFEREFFLNSLRRKKFS